MVKRLAPPGIKNMPHVAAKMVPVEGFPGIFTYEGKRRDVSLVIREAVAARVLQFTPFRISPPQVHIAGSVSVKRK